MGVREKENKEMSFFRAHLFGRSAVEPNPPLSHVFEEEDFFEAWKTQDLFSLGIIFFRLVLLSRFLFFHFFLSFFVSIKLGRERERVVKPDKVCVANLGGFLDSGSEAGMTIEGGDDTIIEEIRRGNL